MPPLIQGMEVCLNIISFPEILINFAEFEYCPNVILAALMLSVDAEAHGAMNATISNSSGNIEKAWLLCRKVADQSCFVNS